jgi:serine/threonine protein phosphatase PrpC
LPGLFQIIEAFTGRAGGKIVRFEQVARTHVGCRRRINEDAMLTRPDLGLWAVADGMGGHDAGEVASALVVELLGAVGADGGLKERAAAAHAALADANRRLVAMAGEGPHARTIGSTVVALAADAQSFTCLWAGDSRAYLARGGALRQLTHDHSLVQQLVDAGDLEPEAAASHPNANIITRAVGAAPVLNLDETDGGLAAGDVLLLASDGLTRLIGDNEILTGLKEADLERLADQWIATCLARQAPDNVTFIILRAHPG